MLVPDSTSAHANCLLTDSAVLTALTTTTILGVSISRRDAGRSFTVSVISLLLGKDMLLRWWTIRSMSLVEEMSTARI